MSAQPKLKSNHQTQAARTASAVNAVFLKYLPALETHAAIHFRGLPDTDRQEAFAEARAAAFVNVRAAVRKGQAHRLKPSMVAHYAVLHARGGRHVGGTQDSTTDVLSRRAQRTRGFKVRSLPWDDANAFDVLKTPDQEVWRLRLRHDRRTPVPDQVCFRIDFSEFMRKQHDRTRTAMAMLAAGHQQTEVADKLGITPSAVCQRLSRARREWEAFQGAEEDGASASSCPAAT